MKKFINTASLLTLVVIVALDAGVAFFLKFAIQKIVKGEEIGVAIFFGLLMLFALFVAFKVTIDQFKTGLEFHADKCVFNGMDCDNTFFYTKIKSVDTEKDEKVSFLKNFLDRSGLLKIETTDGRIHVINLGTLSRRRLGQIKKQLELHIESAVNSIKS